MEWDDKDFPDRNGTDRMPTFRKRCGAGFVGQGKKKEFHGRHGNGDVQSKG